MRRQVALAIALVLAAGLALGAVYLNSSSQLQILRIRPAFLSPEAGMRAHVTESYVGLQGVEIVHAGPELSLLDDLYFVEARVWADDRIDGRMKYPDGDKPGCFFLCLDNGWVLVPEGRRPFAVAIGACLFGLR